MSTVELRHTIIEKLSLIDDTSFLKAIKTIVESKANEEDRQTVSNEAVQKEIRQWLSTK